MFALFELWHNFQLWRVGNMSCSIRAGGNLLTYLLFRSQIKNHAEVYGGRKQSLNEYNIGSTCLYQFPILWCCDLQERW